MELKLKKVSPFYVIYIRSNRTFMELKLAKSGSSIHTSGCSNRTFMELKHRSGLGNAIAKRF
mgnify:CR=1 FL=1